MSTIVIFGGTGYTGRNIAREAVARGHDVVAVSRSTPDDPIDGVRYETGDVLDVAPRVISNADAVVATLSPRGDMANRLVGIYRELATRAAAAGARYVQIGGFSSLRPAPDQPRFVEGDVPEQFRAEAVEGDATREMLVEDAPADLDWVFVSPAGSYGAWAAGERTGRYRVGGEVALFDDEGGSVIGGEDFAIAIVDEIERPAHHRAHIGIAY
ncbi:MAG: NAD(P)-dependent oxidoreductase [Jatrophihabitans sp.]|uniref:NAD(P)-dependent oxidoreductase n=1 Tax=Jatrophihabitans sp. TaxID=1932789 RepID=UPI003F7E3577